VRCRGAALLLQAVAGLLLATAVAQASPRRAIVFPLAGEVPGAPKAPAQLTQVVARAAGLAGADVTVSATAFDEAAAMAGCAGADVACLADVAASVGADEIAVGLVRPRGGAVVVALTLYRDGAITEHEFELAGDLDAMVKQLAQESATIFVGAARAAPAPAAEAPEPVDPVTEPPPAPRAPRPARRSGGGSAGVVGWVLVGGGVAAVAAGGYFGMRSSDAQEEIDAAPVGSGAELDRLAELEDRGARDAMLGNVLLVGGGALAAAGAAVLVYRHLSADGGGDEGGDVAITAVPLRGGAAVALEVPLP
jgi:hypothetical protein